MGRLDGKGCIHQGSHTQDEVLARGLESRRVCVSVSRAGRRGWSRLIADPSSAPARR